MSHQIQKHIADNIRQELKETKAEVLRLTNYIADVNDDREKLLKTFNDKIERMNTNYKILEGQHECVVSDKIYIQRQMGQLKHKNEQQELKIISMKRKIGSFCEKKKKIAEKFHLLKDQENVQDIVVGALKRQFEEQINEFLNEGDTENGRPSADVKESANTSASTNMNRIGAGLVAGGTNNGTELNITAEPEEVQPHSMENNAGTNYEYLPKGISRPCGTSTLDRNHCLTTESRVLHGRSEVSCMW